MGSPLEEARNDQPKKPRKVIPIKRIQGHERATVLVIGHAIEGFDTHWVDRHSEPCWKVRRGICDKCDRKNPLPRRWFGYLHCFCETEKIQCHVEFTYLAKERLEALCIAEGQLRGLRLTFERERKNNKSPVRVLLGDRYYGSQLNIEPKSVIDTLEVVWEKYL